MPNQQIQRFILQNMDSGASIEDITMTRSKATRLNNQLRHNAMRDRWIPAAELRACYKCDGRGSVLHPLNIKCDVCNGIGLVN